MKIFSGDDLKEAYVLAKVARFCRESVIRFHIEASHRNSVFTREVCLWEGVVGRVIGKTYAKSDKPRAEWSPDLPPSPSEVTHYVVEADAISVINAYKRRKESEITRSTAVKRAIYLDNGAR